MYSIRIYPGLVKKKTLQESHFSFLFLFKVKVMSLVIG